MIYIALILFGLALGSFCNAFVWRTYMLAKHKSTKDRAKYSIIYGRSICPHCEHQLNYKDLIPVFSWISLNGKCRYCAKKISIEYPLVELLFAAILTLSYYSWPYLLDTYVGYAMFFVWVTILLLGFCMSIIDIKWQILPTKLVYYTGGLSVIFLILNYINIRDTTVLVNSIIGAITLFGIFWIIYQVSDGKWIGGGDVRLLGVIGVLLGWQKGLLAIVLASYIASFVVLMMIVAKKYHKRMKIPFGPFLLLGTYTALIFGDYFISLYKTISGL